MTEPDVLNLDKNVEKISVRMFAGLASETPDPERTQPDGDIYDVEDPENLPDDSKAHDATLLFRDEEESEEVPVHVWVVQSDEGLYTGLSEKTSLNDNEGMLFDWGEFGIHGLTMRSMSFPIDMAFLDDHGRVERIVERVAPTDDETYQAACRYAVELPAGFCDKHGVRKGWQLLRPVDDTVDKQSVPDEAEHYTDPDDVPEGARIIEGPGGGTYYIPPDKDPENESEDVDLSERTAEIGDDSVHPAKWRRPEEGELDEYINEIQETEFWSDGHEAFERAFHGDESTLNDHTTEDGELTGERREQHESWANELLNEDAATGPGEEPVGMIVLGPPGAGKGWWQEQVAEGAYGDDLGGRQFTQISSDRTKEPIPEYDGSNAAEVHDEASRMAKEELAPQAFENRHNVVVDKVGTSPESTLRMVEAMQEAGYDIRASFVDVPSEASVHNAVGRYEDEGRFTPLDYTASARDDSSESFDTIVEEADIPEEKIGRFDNDVEWGEAPNAEQMGEDLLKFLELLYPDTDIHKYIREHDVELIDERKTRRGRDGRRDSRVAGEQLRRGADGGSRRSSGRRGVHVVDLDKQDDEEPEGPNSPYVEFGNVGGDPFQRYDELEAFVDDLYEAGAEQVYLGNEEFDEASGHHDRPVKIEGLSVDEAESVMDDHEENVLALLGPKEKRDDIVEVRNVHEAPDDVIVHCAEDGGLYYYEEDHDPSEDWYPITVIEAAADRLDDDNDHLSEGPNVYDLDQPDSTTAKTGRCTTAEALRELAERLPSAVSEGVLSKDLGMEVEVFRIVTTEDIADEYDGNLLAVGVDFPNHDVFVDWRTEAWPDGQELGGPHVSIYSSIEDLAQVTQGEIEYVTTVDPEDVDKQMETPPGVPSGAQYLAPDEDAPEGASIHEGPQGATYYVPEGTEDPDRASVDSFGGLTETDSVDSTTIEVDQEDRQELLGYMSSGHERINQALRGETEMSDTIQRHVDTVQSYIDESPDFEEPVEVYRGMTASPDLADRLSQAEGEEIELGGFQSTSHNPQIASRFTNFGDDGDVPIMMNIETGNGLPMYNMDMDAGSGGEEQEVLLGHDWTYQVNSVEETDDGLVVDMEVVSDE